MADFEDGYRYETQAEEEDDFHIPDVIEYFLWGVHIPDNVESSLIGYHQLKKEDLAAPPVKTHDYNDVAMIIILVDNARTKALHNKRFHEGERFFIKQEQFLKENDEKGGKIAVLITNVPIQLAKKAEALKLIERAKPDVVIASLKLQDFKRQFEYFDGNKRFTGRIICQFSGDLEPTSENSTKSNVTYKITQNRALRSDKKSFSPEFTIKKGDAVRESLVFFISKEFDLIRDELENKFDRVDAVGHSKARNLKSGPKLAKVCYRCQNAGIENQRHPVAWCPTICMVCKTLCKNNMHCKKILRKRANDAEVEKWKKRREDDKAVMVFK